MQGPALNRDKSASPILLVAALALVWWVIAMMASLTPGWKQVELKLFDRLMVASSPNKSAFPITIIGIDEASFAELGLQWPWPRRLHGELVDQLKAAGAAVIVFDVLFAEPSGRGKDDDQRFADAIRRAGNVVLAADRTYRESSSVRQWLRLDPQQVYLDAGAQPGLATVTLDPDGVVRQVPDSGESLWRTVVVRLIRDHPEIAPSLENKPDTYIRYAGPDHTFPYVSYHEVVKPTGSIPADFFKDQVVIVGFDVKASVDAQSAQADLFSTPFLASTRFLTPGAEVHANLIETSLARSAIARAPDALIFALIAIVTAASALAMRRWRPFLSALFGMAIAGVVAAATWAAFVKWNLWLPAGSALAIVPLMYVSLGGESFLREQARRREVTRAFGLYVTPQVVDHLLANPDRLKLGGEKREVTFMFTDLAGFTTFSEALGPAKVVNVLNRHFTEMTEIIFRHHGTVARYMGDAIMAFWGAPLDDERQAFNAVTAAIEMQEGMKKLREEFAAEGLPPVNMRVGIQSGSAILGNLGSARRLEYTAIGDDVNLASRLEGTNKLYGTDIMVGEATARQLKGEIPLRRVDRVIVKGQSHPVEVFTPCKDAEIVRMSEEAISLFRMQKWDDSERLWRELLARDANDGIARLYLARIAGLRSSPPEAKWDGAFSLEKL